MRQPGDYGIRDYSLLEEMTKLYDMSKKREEIPRLWGYQQLLRIRDNLPLVQRAHLNDIAKKYAERFFTEDSKSIKYEAFAKFLEEQFPEISDNSVQHKAYNQS